MLRSADWKYVFTTGKTDLGLGYATGNPPPGITHSLYDLKNDPGRDQELGEGTQTPSQASGTAASLAQAIQGNSSAGQGASSRSLG